MAKQSSNGNGILYLIIGVLATLVFMKGGNLFNSNITYITNQTIINQLDQAAQGDCEIMFDKVYVNVGEEVTGTIRDGAYTQCNIYLNYNDGGWGLLATIMTNAQGIYSATGRPAYAGTYEFRAICGSCITNLEEVVVVADDSGPDDEGPDDEDPDDEGPDDEDSSSYTCGLAFDNGMCPGTCPSDYPVCADVEFNDYEACVCLNEDTMMIHPDWKPGAENHYPQEEEQAPPPSCVDNDGVNPFLKSYATWGGNQWWDLCTNWKDSVYEYICEGGVAVKKEILCPNQDCVDGRCATGTTTIWQECMKLGYTRGNCVSAPPDSIPDNCEWNTQFNYLCGDLYPLNEAICCY